MASASRSLEDTNPFSDVRFFCSYSEPDHKGPAKILANITDRITQDSGTTILKGRWQAAPTEEFSLKLEPLGPGETIKVTKKVKPYPTAKKTTSVVTEMIYQGTLQDKSVVFMRAPTYLEPGFSWTNRDIYVGSKVQDSERGTKYDIELDPRYTLV